ncbi:MAG: hypothetical protein ABL997_04075 [Planctomycetota bacterium]
MKTFTQALLFATTTLPLFAQHAPHYEPTALPAASRPRPTEPTALPAASRPRPVDPSALPTTPHEVRLDLQRDKHLVMTMAIDEPSSVFLGVVLGSTAPKMLEIDGLPPLLLAEAIVASGVGQGAMKFDMGPAMLPFSVFLQGVAATSSWIGATKVMELSPAK